MGALEASLVYLKQNPLGLATIFFSLFYMFVGMPSQIFKIWRTKSAKDISPLMYVLLVNQCTWWIFYGKQQDDRLVITANACAAFFGLIILIEYFWFSVKEKIAGKDQLIVFSE